MLGGTAKSMLQFRGMKWAQFSRQEQTIYCIGALFRGEQSPTLTGNFSRECVDLNSSNCYYPSFGFFRLACAALIARPCLAALALSGYTFPLRPHCHPPATLRVGINCYPIRLSEIVEPLLAVVFCFKSPKFDIPGDARSNQCDPPLFNNSGKRIWTVNPPLDPVPAGDHCTVA